MSEDIRNRIIGLMPPQDFLEKFMPTKKKLPFDSALDFSKVPDRSVRQMTENVVRAVTRAKICPGLHLFVTKTRIQNAAQTPMDDSNLNDGSDVDEFADTEDIVPPLAARPQPKPRRKGVKSREVFWEHYDFSNAVLGIEVIPNLHADPFANIEVERDAKLDGEGPTGVYASSSSSEGGRLAKKKGRYVDCCGNVELRGKEMRSFDSLISHVRAQFARQHRCFVFTVILVGRYARFLRFDRAGCIVSERFKYVAAPDVLADFFWRFAHMTEEERGWDMTVTQASKKETADFDQAIRNFSDSDSRRRERRAMVFGLPGAERSLDVDTRTYPTWKVYVENQATGTASHLIVRRPFAGDCTEFGRSTRAYLAYDINQGRVVFLKDSWRGDAEHLLPEFCTLQRLAERKVPCVPDILYGGDVSRHGGNSQNTLAHLLTEEEAVEEATWQSRKYRDALTERVHHRIVQDVHYPLDHADELQLLEALCASLHAIEGAHRVGIIHRDISYRNIMLRPDGKGVLNDWDWAGDTSLPDDLAGAGIGTYEYMSTFLLGQPRKPNDVADDLQSVYWILIHEAIERFEEDRCPLPLDIFEEGERDEQGRWQGGNSKTQCLMAGLLKDKKFTSKAIQELVHHFSDLLGDHIASTPGEGRVARLATDPSYWLMKFSAAVEKERAAKPRAGHVRDCSRVPVDGDGVLLLSCGSSQAQVRTGSKRKHEDDEANEAEDIRARPSSPAYDAENPRRSKRLKAKHI